MKYELINLTLDNRPPVRDFTVGPYKIQLVENYDELHPNMPASGKIRKGYRITEGRTEWYDELIESKAGQGIVTATAECDDEPADVLASGNDRGIWDLCLILSYLSGRHVYIPAEARRYHPNNHGMPVVPLRQLPQAAAIAWDNRHNFSSVEQIRPLWYYRHTIGTSDAEVKLLLSCVSVEIIQRIDGRVLSVSQEAELPAGLQELLNELRTVIDGSKIPLELKNTFKSTVGNWGRSNNVQVFQNLLINYGIIDKDISGVPLDRVHGINRMRNDIVHKGVLRLPKWVGSPTIQNKVVRFVSNRFMPALVCDYLNRKFGLGSFDWVKRNNQILREYIYHATHEGTAIEVE